MPEPLLPSLTTESGSSISFSADGSIEQFEDNPELRWPFSIAVYDRMRKSDGQVRALQQAIFTPIKRTPVQLVGSEVNEKVMKFCVAELGLEVDEQGKRRPTAFEFSWDSFLRHSLLHLPLGHMAFERVYVPSFGGPDENTGLPLVAHLGRIQPRMPRTLAKFDVAPNGDLQAVHQYVQRLVPRTNSWMMDTVRIPAERLVLFVNEQEGADYTGNSILRSAWANWMIKGKLIRLDAMGIERNSMGVPVVSYPSDGSVGAALKIAADFRAGERAGAALPEGYSIELLGVTGSTREALPSINYHDESIGRSALAMHLNLGHDNGARSLGDTFADVFAGAENATTAYIEEVVTDRVIRDLVRVNFGEDEPYPQLKFDEITPDTALDAAALASLVNAKIITPDEKLEADLRRRHGLPQFDAASARNIADVAPTGGEPDPVEADAEPTLKAAPLAAGRMPDGREALAARVARLQSEIAARETLQP